MDKQVKRVKKTNGAVGTAMLDDPLIDTTSAVVVQAMVKAGREATDEEVRREKRDGAMTYIISRRCAPRSGSRGWSCRRC